MSVTLIKEAYVIAYLKNTSDNNKIIHYPLCRVNPDTFNNEKMLEIVDLIKPLLEDAFYIKAVKKIEKHKIIVTK